MVTGLDEARERFGHLPLYRVWPEWGSSGIWMPEAIGGTPGPNLTLDGFSISGGLRERIARWQAVFDDQLPEKMWSARDSYASFSAEGLNIATQFSRELGEHALVEYELGEYCAYVWNVLFLAGRCVSTYSAHETIRRSDSSTLTLGGSSPQSARTNEADQGDD